MSLRATVSRWLGRFLPRSTLWRFVLATLAGGALTALFAMGASTWVGRSMVHDIQEQAGYTVLRNAVDLIGRTRIAMSNLRVFHLEEGKRSLRDLTGFATGLLASSAAGYPGSGPADEKALQNLRRHLEGMPVDSQAGIVVLDAGLNVVAGINPGEVMAVSETWQTRAALVERARAAGGEVVYTLSYQRGEQGVRATGLAAARYFLPWNMTVVAVLGMDALDRDLAGKRREAMNELRARISEISLARTGYVFAFNQDCEMIAHPSLVGEDFASILLPGSERTMCSALKESAEQPWGENRLFYDWDTPEARGQYVYPKVVWVTREPTTGWYVGASAYIESLEAPLPRFAKAIFLPSLASILVLGALLTLLVAGLLKPVKELIEVCRNVSHGRLDVTADENAPGEMGFLTRHFNVMVRRIRTLREKDRLRRRELEVLNRNLEELVARRTRDLEVKAAKLEEANVKLLEMDKLKSAFLSSVSHELRTPLTSVLGFAKLVNRIFAKFFRPLAAGDAKLEQRAAKVSANLGIIEQEGERLTRLINDVLDLNKIESGRLEWQDERIDPAEVITRAAKTMYPVFEESPGLALRLQVAGDLPVISMDPDRLEQVIINLLSNAVKFSSAGEVVLRAFVSGNALRVEVQDPGVGVAEKDMERIFDKFQQVRHKDTLREKPPGTGLGLAICKQIVAHYDGLISLRSTPKEGSTFFFELPLARLDAKSVPTPSRIPPEASDAPLPDASKEAKGPLVLVTDDDDSVVGYLQQLFEQEGFRTVRAANGREAVEKAAAHAPDVITMDLMMPVMDGREAIRALLADPATAAIPVVVVTAVADRTEKLGEAAFQKPFDDDALVNTVRELASGGSVVPSDVPGIYLCADESVCESEAELFDRVEAGYQGMVVFSTWPESNELLLALSANPGIQVVVAPDQGTEVCE